MSEAEIIKIIKEYLSKIYIECTKVGAVGIPNEEWYAIQGLLELYQKEKEKNEELEKYKKYYETEKVVWSRNDYISKDKIKNLIHSYSVTDERFMKYLQELLEERN